MKFFKWIVKKIDGTVYQWSFQRDRVRVCDLSGLKDMFQVFNKLMILAMLIEKEEAATRQI